MIGNIKEQYSLANLAKSSQFYKNDQMETPEELDESVFMNKILKMIYMSICKLEIGNFE